MGDHYDHHHCHHPSWHRAPPAHCQSIHSCISPVQGGTILASPSLTELSRSPGSHLMQQNDLFGAEAAAWQSLASGVTGCREAQSRDSQHLLIIPAPPSLKKEKR